MRCWESRAKTIRDRIVETRWFSTRELVPSRRNWRWHALRKAGAWGRSQTDIGKARGRAVCAPPRSRHWPSGASQKGSPET
jgi:hypothetical protein